MTAPSLRVSPLRTVTAAAAAAAVLLVGAVLSARTAHANPRVVTIVTGSGPTSTVNVREGTGTNTRILRTLPDGARVTIVCHVRGQVFTGGPYRVSTNIWNRLDNGGYITDAMLETGSNNPVVPPCNSAPASGRAMGQTRNSNTGVSGQCTWGAYQKWFEASGRRYYPALSGNARDWATSARAAGWSVVADAQTRSIVVFQPGVHYADQNFGHVGWVDRVERRGDGVYVTITEMNYGGRVGQWNTRTVKDIPGMSYILLP
ncbi:CHAP domain-containing protein [Rhodococcus sp. NCIMB 12038]|uniref:CHAP domain-containing protein n=1 Tax=Rhodococcus sp. NCIMB 12038 TaxID=933800 RepID=UPI000B3C06B3|nr:CHAP domain-containing protein [Rhodococcus sp. NCIMB 12038]OUS97268.1 amidase [Rhodococcus sp. NCIMB 12038]